MRLSILAFAATVAAAPQIIYGPPPVYFEGPEFYYGEGPVSGLVGGISDIVSSFVPGPIGDIVSSFIPWRTVDGQEVKPEATQ